MIQDLCPQQGWALCLLHWYEGRCRQRVLESCLRWPRVLRGLSMRGEARGSEWWHMAPSPSTAEDKGDCLTAIQCYVLNYESPMTLHNEIWLQSNNYRTYPVLEMSQCTFAHGKFWKTTGTTDPPLQSDTLPSFLDVVAGTVSCLWITIIFHYFVNRVLISLDWQYFWKCTIIV